ncbi:Translation initiation inhibitor [Candidatus Burkholderia verschuerenii]|uniref:Translation initiation inhibitor n=1 Tax=Candidatus Burkholderia verschuerenii TaxID=242163 RepID=A0A0L0MCJ9_9BURK|nr:Translation initiation inhibitor [Candidatus Burkholderia verschuerenii]
MTRDESLLQAAIEHGFDPQEEIKVGGKYTPILLEGNIAYVAGQIPRVGNTVRFVGVAGDTVSLDEARRAAATSAVRALLLVRNRFGTLDMITSVPRIGVFMRSAARPISRGKAK